MDEPTERTSLVLRNDPKQGIKQFETEIPWQNPWFFSVTVTLLLLLPTLTLGIILLVGMTDRLYPATPLAVHLSIASIGACVTTTSKKLPKLATLFFSIIDIFFCGFLYSRVTKTLKSALIDLDGTTVVSWKGYYSQIVWIQHGMSLVALSRSILCMMLVFTELAKNPRLERLHTTIQKTKILTLLDRIRLWMSSRIHKQCPNLKASLRTLSVLILLISVIPLLLCFFSCYRYFLQQNIHTPPPYACCDDLDTTDCALPFPSFHHMRLDNSSRTGWRVALQSHQLPPMRNENKFANLSFLNNLDGFSPMGGPILFYLEGLKEAMDAQKAGLNARVFPTLPYDFEDSITERSITLLWNVKDHTLVPHTTRVDYLDPQNPIVLLIPAQPLHHATHYAVAIINATDENGNLLPPTIGMQRLFWDNNSLPCSRDSNRLERYHKILIPSLAQAANWTTLTNGAHTVDSMQLMFDFVTMSDESLAPIRTIRDATLSQLSQTTHQVKITKIQNQNCYWPWTLLARTIHGSLRVPWWLESERRDAILSSEALERNQSNGWGEAKFTIHVPCSLYAAAVNHTSRTQHSLNAILEYGHGLFYNRNEASEYSLLRVAEDQGYLITSMDWRGMSSYDMPVLLKLLLADPNLMQVTRDNIMQGYVCHLAMQHYLRNGLLNESFLQFAQKGEMRSIPTSDDKFPTSVFYGNSQGGILGAAYTALLGPTGLIQRSILGTPAISFTLVLYNSRSFIQYDSLLKMNYFNNRQIRIMLSVLQLAWDAVTPSNILAPPIVEERPPILLQSGLGDPTIPTIATESLVRALNASSVPHNPRRHVFGVQQLHSANGSAAVWTELLFKDQFQSSSRDNQVSTPDTTNLIHQCLRQDCALIAQMVEFIHSGTIMDPCEHDNCLRSDISCYIPGRIRTRTKFGDWRCNYTSDSL